MQIGTLDQYVRIERKTATKDPSYNSDVETWTTYRNCWASVKDMTTRMQEETSQGDQRLVKRPCVVRLRYDSAIDITMRIVVLTRNNRILQIVSKPTELGRREGLEFTCEDYDV